MRFYSRIFAAIVMMASVSAAEQRDRRLDDGWKFLRGDAQGAEQPGFVDQSWRTLDLPHDWSIEDLPGQAATAEEVATASDFSKTPIGPFDPEASPSKHFTGNTVGGIGWYRKHFTLQESGKRVSVRFDGVYMNPEVWLNGQRLGEHPYGYSSFEFDLTPYLKSAGEENVLAVKVRNEGRNSRWYSGSGIYRHVWLTVTDAVHIPTSGVFITTPSVSRDQAVVKVSTEVENSTAQPQAAEIRIALRNAAGKVVQTAISKLSLSATSTGKIESGLTVAKPALWSPSRPDLHTAEVQVLVKGQIVDTLKVPFGIRKIEVDASSGLRINGEPLKLKGGCIHHDNGPLGAAAIDRAEERKIELIKANGFNAIRCSHNPPSPALLDVCDRLGILVINEAFDQWTISKEKNEQDYHGYFKDWWKKDIASMVRRDRNHPSVIFWSIGNEIPEQFRAEDIAKGLREEVLSHDPSRQITAAICSDWGNVVKNWDKLSDPAFLHLDVAGYNYLPEHYEGDHKRHPDRVIVTTESYPRDTDLYWSAVEKNSYVIGDFVWTAMDYFGEAGIGHSVLSTEKDSFFMPWPWFNAWCGDIDVCGFKKPQSLYRDVVWRRSPVEILVHTPVPEGVTEKVSGWGWPSEVPSWNWAGQEGKTMQVAVYTRADEVRLELNGKAIGSKKIAPEDKLTARFELPYAAGELKAIALSKGKVIGTKVLASSGAPKKLKLTVDRSTIRADRNDLAYVSIEVTDEQGRWVPDAEPVVHFSVSGAGELAAQCSANPRQPASFRAPLRKTYQGRCLAILRPTGAAGEITLTVKAEGYPEQTVSVQAR